MAFRASRAEIKQAATTRAAVEIVQQEALAAATKTERLRAARLARELAEQAPRPAKRAKRGAPS